MNFVLQIKRFTILAANQEGLAECIANEDGERQIACAIAFHGEEIVRERLIARTEILITYTVHRKSSKKSAG